MSKEVKKYYDLVRNQGLHASHRVVIDVVNRLLNGDPDSHRPGLRDIVVGRELERVATSAVIGMLSVSDPNPTFHHVVLRQHNGEMSPERVVTKSVLVAGNILLTGLPGGGKTLLARSLAALCDLSFAPVQMTPDLTPRDLIATTVQEGGATYTYLGPVFNQVVLADEINRATPKTQAALLQRMSSGVVTLKEKGREVTKPLPQPCFTMATRNPIEEEGTYPLPEAQLDRFLYGINFPLPSEATILDVLRRVPGHAQLTVSPLTSGDEILACRDFIVNEVEVPEEMIRYIGRLILATYQPFACGVLLDLAAELGGENIVVLPPNSRAALHLLNSAKTLACIDGTRTVEARHVKKRFYEVVNHRFVLKSSAFGLDRYGGVDGLIRSMIKGDPSKGTRGILDVVPIEG